MAVMGVTTVGLWGCGDDVTSGGDGTDGGSTTQVDSTPPTSASNATTSSGSSSDPTTSTPTTDGSTDTTDGSADSTSSTGDDTSGDGSSSSGTVLPPCDYPIRWPADAAAQGQAQTELDALSPEATMTWNDDRGALTSIQDLDVVFDCDDNAPLLASVFDFLEAHPDLFQIDASEWFVDSGTSCLNVDDANPTTFNTSRRDFGDWTVSRDVIAVRLYRNEDGDVAMRSVSGTYVPTLDKEVAEQIAYCIDNGPNPGLLEDAMRTEPFDYVVYGGGALCQASGQGQYTAVAADEVTFSDNAQISWSDAADGSTTVTIAQRLELVLDPTSHTDELRASSAACPNPDGPGTIIGFSALLDLVTAEVENPLAGLGCIVC